MSRVHPVAAAALPSKCSTAGAAGQLPSTGFHNPQLCQVSVFSLVPRRGRSLCSTPCRDGLPDARGSTRTMSDPSNAAEPGHWGPPYLLYLGSAADDLAIKTARGLAYWRPDWCVGQLRRGDCKPTLGLPEMSVGEARKAGANTMVIGAANAGGVMSSHIVAAARRHGRELFDARDPMPGLPVGNGRPRAGRRLLTVGTDCSVGKMYTTLAIERSMRRRGLAADFRATGQTGILVAGSGIPIDAVVADFISGAAEKISPARLDGGWDLIEGQGSLFHPSYAGVSLGLLHGSQADALVLCHEPTRQHMRGLPDYPLPELKRCLQANLVAAQLTSPNVKAVGVRSEER